MKKSTVVLLCSAIILVSAPVSAQTAATTDVQAQIKTFLAQIRALQTQVDELLRQQQSIAGGVREAVAAIRIERGLSRGATGEDVRALQETLATDPDVYPEGIVSGYFGPLTEAAVRRFQGRFGMEQVGVVGPQTREHINYILENGAGASGIIPPGLLMKFKGQSVFEGLPGAAKARCKARSRIPAGRVPFGIFAQCDDMASPSNGESVGGEGGEEEVEEEEEIEQEDEQENESEDESGEDETVVGAE